MAYLDTVINTYAAVHTTPFLIHAAALVSSIGGTGIVAGLGIVIAIIYAFRHRLQSALIMFFAVVITTGAVLILKDIFERARPMNAVQILTDYSFPSGHAAMAAAFFVALLYVVRKDIRSRITSGWLTVVAILIVFVIGVSRLILNVHWFSDVLGGWSVGLLGAALSIYVIRRLKILSKYRSL